MELDNRGDFEGELRAEGEGEVEGVTLVVRE